MSRKDYIAIGDVLKKYNEVIYRPLLLELIDVLSDTFLTDNPRFKKDLFLAYVMEPKQEVEA